MNVQDTRLPGLKRIELAVFHDDRGYFLETYQAARYAQALGADLAFVQDNCSHSGRGVLRGLHYQVNHPQGKLVRVAHGEVFDVAVDLRPDSVTFGQWEGFHLVSPALSQERGVGHTQLWIPPGFAHGFYVQSDTAMVEYKCTDTYHPNDEACLVWHDADVAIAWPDRQPVLSDKDRAGLSLRALRHDGLLPCV